MVRAIRFRAWPVSGLSVATVLVTVALSVAAGTAQAETADERDLRDHAAGNDLPAVQSLLAKGTSPNVPDHSGRTAVHHAAAIAKAAILEALLEAGGDPDVPDASGATPLHLAADFPYFEPDSQLSVRVLLHYGAEPGLADSEGRTPLHLVAGNHEGAAAVRDLLSSGADANAVDTRGDTPLHHAIGRSGRFSIDVVAALVDGGARADAVGGSGETPLQLFARVGTDDGRIVDALLAGGADPDAKNPDGETPLHTAVRSGGGSENPEVVAALLAAGADPCIADTAGYIPYNTAREGGRVHAMLADADGYDRVCDGHKTTAALDAELVRQIQSALAARGYDPGPADGVMGSGTRSAIAAWQDAEGFPATGEPTDDEVAVLLSEIASSEIAAGPPGQLCSGSGDDVSCWLTVSDRDGCYVWKPDPAPDETVTWSGACQGGRASGAGIETSTYRNWNDQRETRSLEGTYVDGLRNGHWVSHWDGGSAEGSYVDGKMNGHWVWRWLDGHVWEGPYVDGKMNGRWVERTAAGHVSEGPRVDGKRNGHWVERSADGEVWEGPFVDDERNGKWIARYPDGRCVTYEWSNDRLLGSDSC